MGASSSHISNIVNNLMIAKKRIRYSFASDSNCSKFHFHN